MPVDLFRARGSSPFREAGLIAVTERVLTF